MECKGVRDQKKKIYIYIYLSIYIYLFIYLFIYLKHPKKSLGIPCFLWPLQQIGNKTGHFCGICIVLEVEPLARKVLAGHCAFI